MLAPKTELQKVLNLVKGWQGDSISNTRTILKCSTADFLKSYDGAPEGKSRESLQKTVLRKAFSQCL